MPLMIMYVVWGILFFTFPLVKDVAHTKVFYTCWVLLFYLVMSGHYVLIQGAVFLATVSSLSFRVSLTVGDITFYLTQILGTRSTRISGHNGEQ